MSGFDLAVYTMKFMIPSVFAVLFRAFGLGYRSRRRLIWGLVVFALYSTIVPAVLIATMGYGQYTHIVSLVMTVGGMSVLIFSTDPPGKTILLLLIVAQINTSVSVPLNMVRHIFGLSYLMLDIILLVVCPIVYLIALRIWARPLRFMADNMHGRLTAPMLIPIVATAMIYVIPVFPAQNFVNYPVYCTMMMLAVEFSFFLYIYTLYRSMLQISALSDKDLDEEILRMSVASMTERMRIMDEAAYQGILADHDRRHFNSMVLELLEQGEPEQAAALIKKQMNVNKPEDGRCCENSVINAAVSYYAALAKEKGIVADIGLDIPGDLFVDSLELAIAVSNLLENAIHGCEALPDDMQKFLRFTCRDVGRLAMEITNPCTKNTALDQGGYPMAREVGHGVGTKSVLAFVAKYDAELFYSVENGVFTVRLLV